jgi:hypothetical protein
MDASLLVERTSAFSVLVTGALQDTGSKKVLTGFGQDFLSSAVA